MKNLQQTSLKFSTLEHRLNMLVLCIFGFNALILLVSALMSGMWHANYGSDALYFLLLLFFFFFFFFFFQIHHKDILIGHYLEHKLVYIIASLTLYYGLI